MEIFTFFVLAAVLLLLGNLIRLFNCTRDTWAKTTDTSARTKSAMLFILYLIITCLFIWCACAAICGTNCPLV